MSQVNSHSVWSTHNYHKEARLPNHIKELEAFFPLIVSNTYSFLIHAGMMMIYTGSSNVISRP